MQFWVITCLPFVTASVVAAVVAVSDVAAGDVSCKFLSVIVNLRHIHVNMAVETNSHTCSSILDRTRWLQFTTYITSVHELQYMFMLSTAYASWCLYAYIAHQRHWSNMVRHDDTYKTIYQQISICIFMHELTYCQWAAPWREVCLCRTCCQQSLCWALWTCTSSGQRCAARSIV